MKTIVPSSSNTNVRLAKNVINQGLFYLDWLMDYKAEFELLVINNLDKASAKAIDWSAPRVICIANDFTKYDEHAVQQIGRNIELFRYKQFSTEFLLLELVNFVSQKTLLKSKPPRARGQVKTGTLYGAACLPPQRLNYKTFLHRLKVTLCLWVMTCSERI